MNRDEPADDAVDDWFTMEIGGGVRRTRITARGKRDQVLSWRVAHADSARRTFKSMREPYRRMMREADPTGAYALTMSNLTATALARALHNPATWIGTVENDGRMNPKAVTPGKRGRTSTFGVLWPVRLIELLQEKYETFDASLVWPEGFRLTKANFMAAAILYELETVEQWLVEIPNDDRQVVLGNVEQSIGLA